MLESFPVILIIASLLGFLSGLGVGGGSLLIIWLTLAVKMDHTPARNLNLMFFVPCALVASLFRWKQGALDLKKILPAILFGCIGAGIFSFLGKSLDTGLLKKFFGVLLLLIGVREIFYRQRKAK